MRLLLFCIFLTLSGGTAAAAGDSQVTDETDWVDDVEEKDRTMKERFLDTSDDIGRQVDRMADAIDMLLAGKRYTRLNNQSNARLSQVVTHSEGGVTRTSTDFNLNIRLPNLEKRWAIRFTSYDEAEESRDLQQRRVRTRPRRREYGASVGFFKNFYNIKTTFQPRLVLRDPLEMSYVLRFETGAKFPKFRLIPRLELFADALKGTGEFVSLEFVIPLSSRWELSLQNEEEYRERGNLFTTNHGITFDYALSDTQGLGLSFIWGSTSRPSFHLNSFMVAPSYAQEIFRDRLRYSLTPFLLFAKSDRFKGDAGVTLNVVVTF